MSRFPLAEKPIAIGQSVGMVISLPGVLNRAAERCARSRDDKHLEYPLTQLLEHINHVRASESDEQALERLEKFLRLWVST